MDGSENSNNDLSCSPPTLQLSRLITGCANPTSTIKGGTTLDSTARASQTTRPTCSAVTTTTRPSSTAATTPSFRRSCRSTSPPPQTVTHTSKSALNCLVACFLVRLFKRFVSLIRVKCYNKCLLSFKSSSTEGNIKGSSHTFGDCAKTLRHF